MVEDPGLLASISPAALAKSSGRSRLTPRRPTAPWDFSGVAVGLMVQCGPRPEVGWRMLSTACGVQVTAPFGHTSGACGVAAGWPA